MEEHRDGTVGEVIDGRRGVYGDPAEMFARAAQIWSGIIGYEINAVDVPLMLMGYKILRAQHTPDYSDNSDDIEGYLDIFREIVGDDMVHARSVSEYLEAKAGADLVSLPVNVPMCNCSMPGLDPSGLCTRCGLPT
jgi:hypothetical protein